MLKKSLIILSVVCALLFISTLSFAVTSNDVKNGISNVTDTVVDGAANLGNDVRNGVGTVENGINGAVRNIGDNNNTNNNALNNQPNNNYNATRTSAGMTTQTNTGFGNTTLWTWLILAVIGIVIVALVWYYGSQNINNNNHHNL